MGIWELVIVVWLIALYWLPTILAFNRGVTNQWSIAVINLFLGWTLIGWVVALALALRTVHKDEQQPIHTTVAAPVAEHRSGSPDAAVSSVERLADLYREGLLTEDEYSSAKARLLDRGD